MNEASGERRRKRLSSTSLRRLGLPPSGSHTVVYVVVDDLDQNQTVTMLLGQEDYLAMSARSVGEAMERMRTIIGPAIVILDLEDIASNRRLLDAMNAEPLLRNVPVIIPSTTVRGVVGRVHYIAKPIDPTELLFALALHA